MLIFKCPECEDSLMGFNEAENTWVCSETECQHELEQEEADSLFESGELLAYVESDDDDQNLFEEEDEEDDDDDMDKKDKKDKDDDDDEDDDDSKDESFNGFANKDTWMVNLVVQNEYKVQKGAISAIAEADEDDVNEALQKFVEKKVAKDDNYASVFEDIDLESVDWSEVAECITDTQKEMAAISEDLEKALGVNEDVSDEDRNNIKLVFESALIVKYNELKGSLEEKFETELEEAKEENFKALTVEMSGYFDEIVEEWMEENKIALEHGIQTEMTQNFMEGLRDLFGKYYIDIPEERFDILQDMSDKIENMEEAVADSKAREAELQNKLDEASKETIIHNLSEELTDTQVEKLEELASSIDYESEEQFESAMKTLKASFITEESNSKDGDIVTTDEIEDLNEDNDEKEVDLNDPIALAARGMNRKR